MQETPFGGAGTDAPAGIHRVSVLIEEVCSETGRSTPSRLRRAAAGALVTNPWVGRRVHDLSVAAEPLASTIAEALTRRLIGLLGGAAGIEAFGKAAVVGLRGEQEHGAALIHTPHLGDRYRAAVEGSSIIAFTELRAEAGTSIAVPMWHKTHAATRSHYQAVDFRMAAAPAADEILVVLAAATGPRPFARIGDRTTDHKPSDMERAE